MLNQDPVFSN